MENYQICKQLKCSKLIPFNVSNGDDGATIVFWCSLSGYCLYTKTPATEEIINPIPENCPYILEHALLNEELKVEE